MMDIYEEILKALEVEDRVMLATIISTQGSTPASALSKMLVRQGGIVSVGTVGGGCMEGDVLLHAHRLYDSGKSEILTFHLNEDDIEQGLICGGSLDVLIEPLTKQHIPLIQEIKATRDEGEDGVLVTLLGNDGVKHKGFIKMNAEVGDEWIGGLMGKLNHFQQSISELATRSYHRNETCRFPVAEGEVILEPITGCPSLIIFGGGHVSKYVSRAAAMAGFRVTILDDRPKFANSQRFPEATRTLAIDFLDAFEQCSIKPSIYIVIVTRGHRHDEDILERALQTPAKYIGMIGSRRKVLTTYEHLVERGTSVEALKRVHAPMGIDIGAVTAEEIGISIVAELIKVRRGESLPLRHKSEEMVNLFEKLKAKFPNYA
jgi:xanthine dehydrogenase accessory factor